MNKETAAKKIRNIASRGGSKSHLGRKAAYFYSHTWNRTMGEVAGMYPKYFPENAERYRRGSMLFKALLRDMKEQNVGTVYRGLSESQARQIIREGKLERKTFSSFTEDIKVADEFAEDSNTVLRIRGRVPCIKYDDRRYVSMYNTEKEVLLPPGVFTLQPSKNVYFKYNSETINGTNVYNVTFTPIQVQVPRFSGKRANTKTSPNNNMNLMWRQKKIHNLEKQLTQLYANRVNVNQKNMNHAANYNTKKNDPSWKRKNATIDKLRKTLNTQIGTIQKRIQALKRGVRNVPSYANI
jgi:hypothetical protein